MSYRPTIAVYVNGAIADIGLYRNWKNRDLLYEAIVIAALYGDCCSVEEYRMRRYGRQEVRYYVEPVLLLNTQKNLKFIEDCSELPVVVDLTAGCIYCSYGALSPEELAALPSALEENDSYGTRFATVRTGSGRRVNKKVPVRGLNIINRHTDFCLLLEKCKIPFRELDLAAILRLFRMSDSLRGHLSEDTTLRI